MNRAFLFILFTLASLTVSGQDFFIVFLNKKEDKAVLPEEEVKKLMDGHMANINRLAKAGKLWAAARSKAEAAFSFSRPHCVTALPDGS